MFEKLLRAARQKESQRISKNPKESGAITRNQSALLIRCMHTDNNCQPLFFFPSIFLLLCSVSFLFSLPFIFFFVFLNFFISEIISSAVAQNLWQSERLKSQTKNSDVVVTLNQSKNKNETKQNIFRKEK